MYVDGVLQDTKNIGALEIWTGYGNKDLQWGNSNHGSAVPYEGKIRESRIYKRLLTETEIGELYANDTAVITPVTASLTGNASRDNNHVPVMMAVDSTDATKKLPVYVNPDTGAVLIETN